MRPGVRDRVQTESLLLALAAGAAGTLLAHWLQPLLVALTPAAVVRLAETGIDGGVLVFTLGVSIATSGFFGLVPALHASRVDLIAAARQGSLTAGRTVRARGVLVVAQVALAVVLLTAAGLLSKSLAALQSVELGFRPENVLVIRRPARRLDRRRTGGCHQPLPLAAPFRKRPRRGGAVRRARRQAPTALRAEWTFTY